MANTNLPTNVTAGTADHPGLHNDVNVEINELSRNTGLRDVTSLLANGWTATAVRIERVRDRVYLYLRGLDGSAASGTSFMAMSSLGGGFSPMDGSYRGPVLWDSTPEPGARITITNAGFLGTTGMVMGGQWVEVSYRTVQSFPSSFPGTAV